VRTHGRDFNAQLDRIQGRLQARLGDILERVRAEALGHAVIGVRRNVYDTTPSAYERTGNLLRSLDATKRQTRASLTVILTASAEYASNVEYGSGPGGVSDTQVLTRAEARQDQAAPLYLGRTGRNYLQAGPFLLPAAAYAKHRLLVLFSDAVQDEWR